MSSCQSQKEARLEEIKSEREKSVKAALKSAIKHVVMEAAIFPGDFSGHIDIALHINRAKIAVDILKELITEFESYGINSYGSNDGSCYGDKDDTR